MFVILIRLYDIIYLYFWIFGVWLFNLIINFKIYFLIKISLWKVIKVNVNKIIYVG